MTHFLYLNTEFLQISRFAAEICYGNDIKNGGRWRHISTFGSGINHKTAYATYIIPRIQQNRLMRVWFVTIRQIFSVYRPVFYGDTLEDTLVLEVKSTERYQFSAEHKLIIGLFSIFDVIDVPFPNQSSSQMRLRSKTEAKFRSFSQPVNIVYVNLCCIATWVCPSRQLFSQTRNLPVYYISAISGVSSANWEITCLVKIRKENSTLINVS